MRLRHLALSIAAVVTTSLALAQGHPVADALRAEEEQAAKNLIAAAEDVPESKLTYKPTPAQMSFGDIWVHLIQGNDYFCGNIGGVEAPKRTPIKATAPKKELVDRLKETFHFCHEALEHLDDSNLSGELPFFGGPKKTRAAVILITAADWADHYSQVANYMRLNGMLPPTAKKQ